MLVLPSVKFRVTPWQMLNLILPCILCSVKFRVLTWQMLLLFQSFSVFLLLLFP